MTYTLELPPDTEARAWAQADAQGVAVEDVLISLIELGLPAPPQNFKTGADVVTYWHENGLVGIWADRPDIHDNIEYAHLLRHQAETRSDA